MTELLDFLQARLAEDERAAQQQMVPIPGSRESDEPPSEWPRSPGRAPDRRMLLDVDAKRRIIELYAEAAAEEHGLHPEADPCREVLDIVMHLLALPYADHPDYDRSWNP
ncbi:hypothetical protein HDA32_004419 [Spinactinospora alkalitolerans]|uniref:Uncharacterized protein n=1 Tax=Spinactinospora alkalitolerans TaxID=687207 RepID=A0A852TZ79_9ACTN|nr:DUF6221 family protein [Spinactinospora alkalitolerans]NYE49299.1 hypothetical protein [Spinactinospora alkalitolerans]